MGLHIDTRNTVKDYIKILINVKSYSTDKLIPNNADIDNDLDFLQSDIATTALKIMQIDKSRLNFNVPNLCILSWIFADPYNPSTCFKLWILFLTVPYDLIPIWEFCSTSNK